MVCRAAVKIYDKRQDKEIIIPCHRHCDAFQILHDFGYVRKRDFEELGQGFLDEHGNYLTRIEAHEHVVKIHQATTSDFSLFGKELYSEDLW